MLSSASVLTSHAAHAAMPTTSIASSVASLVALADPTRPDFSQATPTEKSKAMKRKKKSPIARLSLQQTLISNKRKFAVINGKTMTIGKKIRGAKLIQINSDYVVLTYRGKRYTLNLTHPSSIKEVKR